MNGAKRPMGQAPLSRLQPAFSGLARPFRAGGRRERNDPVYWGGARGLSTQVLIGVTTQPKVPGGDLNG